jgi:hypothetical protein
MGGIPAIRAAARRAALRPPKSLSGIARFGAGASDRA